MGRTHRPASPTPMPRPGARAWAEAQTQLLEEAVERRVSERTAALQRGYEHEHRLAQTLQRALLLTPPLTRLPGLAAEAVTEMAAPEALVSGDFCDAFLLDTGEVALVIGDVCGKGMVAAVRVPEIKFALRAFLSQCASPAHALCALNDWLCAGTRRGDTPPTAFATVAVLVLNPETGLGVCSSAGAEPPILLRPLGRPEPIPAFGLALGVEAGWSYESRSFHLGRGDLLLMATDGITEARSGDTFLGDAGLADLAMRTWQTAETAPALAVARGVLEGARRFAGGTLHDDASVLAVERHRFCPRVQV